jgi:hypothetical protein
MLAAFCCLRSAVCCLLSAVCCLLSCICHGILKATQTSVILEFQTYGPNCANLQFCLCLMLPPHNVLLLFVRRQQLRLCARNIDRSRRNLALVSCEESRDNSEGRAKSESTGSSESRQNSENISCQEDRDRSDSRDSSESRHSSESRRNSESTDSSESKDSSRSRHSSKSRHSSESRRNSENISWKWREGRVAVPRIDAPTSGTHCMYVCECV